MPSSQETTADLRNPIRANERRVVDFIDTQLLSVLDELSKDGGRPSITLKRRLARTCYSLNQQTGALQSGNQASACTYFWPGRSTQEAWRFGIILRILGHISEAIHGGYVGSKRDIFYQDPKYFGSQRLVDGYIDDIAYTIGVDRMALHLVAAAKGLTAGCYKIMLENQTLINVEAYSEGIAISRLEEIEKVDLSRINWILVVEKEAIFHRLVTSGYHKTSAAGRGILVTGKGYPDLNTRAFLRLLSQTRRPSSDASESASIPLVPSAHILVDDDPDGMAIMSTYKYGSMAQIHENANLNVTSLRWLGVRTSKLLATGNVLEKASLIPLTLRDRKKAYAMLANSPCFAEDGPEPTWREELQRMLFMNVKAEIEILYDLDGGVESWLDKELRETN